MSFKTKVAESRYALAIELVKEMQRDELIGLGELLLKRLNETHIPKLTPVNKERRDRVAQTCGKQPKQRA